MRTACIMFLFALLLQGCGKKGPLMLPKPEPSQSVVQQPVLAHPASQPAAAQPVAAQQPPSNPAK